MIFNRVQTDYDETRTLSDQDVEFTWGKRNTEVQKQMNYEENFLRGNYLSPAPKRDEEKQEAARGALVTLGGTSGLDIHHG